MRNTGQSSRRRKSFKSKAKKHFTNDNIHHRHRSEEEIQANHQLTRPVAIHEQGLHRIVVTRLRSQSKALDAEQFDE